MGREKNFGDKINTNGFDKNPNNIGDGRKKKIYTILKEKGFGADDIRTAMAELAFYTLDELKQCSADESKPSIVRILAQQYEETYKKKDWNKIREIIEQSIGKATQQVKVESKKPIQIITDDPEKFNKDIDN